MPDEAFETLWALPGGPELVALHAMFDGRPLPMFEVRGLTGTTPDQLREALRAAHRVGLLRATNEDVMFIEVPPDSGQRARLDWCLEPHAQELPGIEARLRGRLLLKLLESPSSPS